MKQLNEHHSFTGMQRDMSIAKHPSSFLYDAHNIRLTARGEDTLLTITNERGPSYAGVEIKGTYLGHCLLGKYLIVFSTGGLEEDDDTLRDYITRIDLSTKESVVLYKGNLGFDVNNLIETVASYENEKIQKIYWTDGENPPRLINIVGDIKENIDTQFNFIRDLNLQETITIQKVLGASGSFAPGVIQYAFTYYDKHGQESNIFYISPLLYISHKDRGGSPEDKVDNAFRISIKDVDKSFDYVRIYSIQRTSIDAVPIVKRVEDISTDYTPVILESTYNWSPTSFSIKATYNEGLIANPTDNVTTDESTNLFEVGYTSGTYGTHEVNWNRYKKSQFRNLKIKISNYTITWGKDSNDDSMLWVSTNGIRPIDQSIGAYGFYVVETTDATHRILEPATIYNQEPNTISFLDTGTSGDSVDPTELLYKGGESIIAQTIEQKDNTLFLGNIKLERLSLKDNVDGINIESAVKETSIEQDTRTFYPTEITTEGYKYFNQLTAYADEDNKISVPCGGFKRGDYYRCGVQFQYKNGRWSDPIFLNDVLIGNTPSYTNSNYNGSSNTRASITLPTLKGVIPSSTVTQLLNLGYRKARALVVFPDPQDRVVLCQGVVCPTMYTTKQRDDDKSLYAQSSWFFRPYLKSGVNNINNNNTVVSPVSTNFSSTLPYTKYSNKWSQSDINTLRMVEIQGDFSADNGREMFRIENGFATLHSPDFVFDDQSLLMNFDGVRCRKAGNAGFTTTMSDINIQLSSPAASVQGAGFIHKSFVSDYSYGIVSGTFFEDYAINDRSDKLEVNKEQRSPVKWLVYPWHRNGSLNNDINRPSDAGTRTAELKKKVISNLRYAETHFLDTFLDISIAGTPQLYSSDQVTIVKVGDDIYQGNIDTMLTPDKLDGLYFTYDGSSLGNREISTAFNSTSWWRTYTVTEGSTTEAKDEGFYKWKKNDHNEWGWYRGSGEADKAPGEHQYQLVLSKETVRMRYKSTPHLVLKASVNYSAPEELISSLPIYEIIRVGDDYSDGNKNYYRATMFGGTSEDALKVNKWIPCGEPVSLVDGSACTYSYSYGDTYFQRWDCLKTYPFSNDDINQIIEIGSFMLETRVNIDGRYDRNRGQINNLNVSPVNFNLFNPVYNQTNNFFTYRILDESYYKIDKFSNQITWTKEKKAGADVDLWTNITLASTYDMDGSKGEVRAIRTWQDNIYCFQDLGISNILFNSRVQIPTSDGVPIEISNSYKVDGYRYISDGIGCTNKWTISNTPSGLYFADTKTNHLHHIGSQGIQDVTTIHNMTSWFNNVDSNRIIKTLHDDVNHDLYALTPNESICYSEVLGNFTSFMSYQGISLIESYENSVYTMKDGKLYSMFTGEYNKFFGENYEPWDFTFISNGIDNNLMDFDKVYSTIDYRMDMSDSTDYKHDNSLDVIRVYNEYQDTGNTDLIKLKVIDDNKFLYHKDITLRKKFRIWRIQIPRAIKSKENPETHKTEYYRSNDRIRNTWCKIKLGSKGKNNYKAVLHDLNVQYYL